MLSGAIATGFPERSQHCLTPMQGRDLRLAGEIPGSSSGSHYSPPLREMQACSVQTPGHPKQGWGGSHRHQPAAACDVPVLAVQTTVGRALLSTSAVLGTQQDPVVSCGLHAIFCTYLTFSNHLQNSISVNSFLQRLLFSLKEQKAISF